jgi:hypothetical protein
MVTVGRSEHPGDTQQAPDHRFIALGPALGSVDTPVNHDQLQRADRGAFGQHRD